VAKFYAFLFVVFLKKAFYTAVTIIQLPKMVQCFSSMLTHILLSEELRHFSTKLD